MAGLTYKRRRWRRRLAWLNLGGVLALIVASAASFQWSLIYTGSTRQVIFTAGGLVIGPKPARIGRGFELAGSMAAMLPWMERLELFFRLPQRANSNLDHVPLGWPVVILAAGSTIALWKVPRGFPDGHCQSCGYNLTGNESGICPECGTATARRANDGCQLL